MLIPIKNMTGQQVGEMELDDSVFAAPINESLMHQALVRQLANARLGTHKTKGRSEVRGGGRKPWRQKGTGRARQGSIRAPNWVGGGTVFGPTPRKYTKAMPKKMRRNALRSALTVKASSDQIVIIDEVAFDVPRTKSMVAMLDSLSLNDQNVLMVLGEKNLAVQRSASNLPTVKTLLASYVNIRDLLGHDTVLVTKDAVEQIEVWLATDGGPTASVHLDDADNALPNEDIDVSDEREDNIEDDEAEEGDELTDDASAEDQATEG